MKTREIKQAFHIRAPVASVFKALSEPKMLTRWFLGKAELEPQKGGKYCFTWIGSYAQNGNVLDFKKNEKMVIDWTGAKERTVVTFTTKKAGRETQLIMRQSGFTNSTTSIEEARGVSAGWAYYLMNLKSVLENNSDLRHKQDNLFG